MKERLQKILSAAGVCSRRKAEEYLKEGRVTVNGLPVGLGDSANPDTDLIAVDGIPVTAVGRRTYIMLHKPRGFVTTLSDEKGRRTVSELVADCGARVWPVGRLDMDSEGLLLLTDDGEFTNRLTHPSHEVDKEYVVWGKEDLTEEMLGVLSRPMELDGQKLRAAAVKERGARSLSIVIHEGKNRQVRRMCAAVGFTVTRLKRVREGSLSLGDLPKGEWRYLTPGEVSDLLK